MQLYAKNVIATSFKGLSRTEISVVYNNKKKF